MSLYGQLSKNFKPNYSLTYVDVSLLYLCIYLEAIQLQVSEAQMCTSHLSQNYVLHVVPLADLCHQCSGFAGDQKLHVLRD